MAEKLYGDRWKIIESIGEGGQGQVFKVEDTKNENKIYVLKRLKNSNRIGRFKIEIETIEKLSHPNIVKLIDYNLDSEKPHLVTEYCVGGELTFDKVSKISIIERLSLFSTICKAIGYAHENGVIHRDIKPANILLRDDGKTPIITDFGICFNTDEGFERITETIEQVGTRFFMAPELADGRAEDIKPSCDVYSLGKLLYWLIRGRIFDREKFADKNWELRKNSSDHSLYFIYDIFDKTITEKPDDRFKNAQELCDKISKAVKIIKKDGHYLNAKLPQLCVFCTVGFYQQHYDPKILDRTQINQGLVLSYSTSKGLGFNYPDYEERDPRSISWYPKILYLICNHCGNTQIFNLDIHNWEIEKNWKEIRKK